MEKPKTQKEKSAGAIIFRMVEGQPHYLLLRYPSKHWEFAKGHIEENEHPEMAAKREIQEETGISEVMILPGFKEYSKYFFRKSYGLEGEAKKRAPWVFKLVVFYVAETRTEAVRLSPEHIGFAWLPIEAAVKRITYKNAKELLKKAHEFVISAKGLRGSQEDPSGPSANV